MPVEKIIDTLDPKSLIMQTPHNADNPAGQDPSLDHIGKISEAPMLI